MSTACARRKGNKYGVILEEFLESEEILIVVEMQGKDTNYTRTQLKKRFEAYDLGGQVKISVINNQVYLEK